MGNQRLCRLAVLMTAGLLSNPVATLGQGNIFERAQKKMEEAQKKLEQVMKGKQTQPGAPGSTPGQPVVGGSLAPLEAKVEETLLGPMPTATVGKAIFSSDDGDHIAVVAPKGSRRVMMIDGVEGPVFDEIGGAALGEFAAFSPAGGRFAYVARRGTDLIAVVDGKEAGVVSRVEGHGYGPPILFTFNQDGSRLAYPSYSPNGRVHMVVDGEPNSLYAGIDIRQVSRGGKMAYSAQIALRGSHLAYVVKGNDGQMRAVVDGKESAPYSKIQSLVMTKDGSHYAFVGSGANGDCVIVDGVAGPEQGRITYLELAPDGRVAYLEENPAAGGPRLGGPGSTLFVNHRPVSGDLVFPLEYDNPLLSPQNTPIQANPYGIVPEDTTTRYVAFSPDGKRFAYVGRSGAGKALFVDDEPGLEYQNIKNVQFSKDGRRLAYVAGNGAASMFVVVDGEELPQGGNIRHFQFSPDSTRYAYEIQGSGKNSVVVDGKEGPSFYSFQEGTSTFSPDSKNFYYGVCSPGGAKCDLIVDGQPGPASVTNWNSHPLPGPSLVFSADSSRLAYLGRQRDGTGTTMVMLDGAPIIRGSTAGYPSFSPSSKHFAVAAWINQKWTITVDGKAGPVLDRIWEGNQNAVRFIDEHTVRVIAIKNGSMYRITVDVGESGS